MQVTEVAENCASKVCAVIDFEQLYRNHHQVLHRFVRRFLSNPHDIEDVVQTTFYEAMRSAHLFVGLAKPSTWLMAIAKNVARAHYRRLVENPCDSVEEEVFELVGELDHDPADLLAHQQTLLMVDKILNELPDGLRDTFVILIDQDCAYDEIAEILGIPLGTVRSRISRVRSALREGIKN